MQKKTVTTKKLDVPTQLQFKLKKKSLLFTMFLSGWWHKGFGNTEISRSESSRTWEKKIGSIRQNFIDLTPKLIHPLPFTVKRHNICRSIQYLVVLCLLSVNPI